ncbi:hypothetical protein ABER98_02320 [Domibacillus aminovorans]|uniref:hypothetical protein n=1 Tax=Bacillaceae TaxID=186817 RepID=UPI00036B49B8|nr:MULTISPECIES: hypothetical protein [Bacillaceae]
MNIVQIIAFFIHLFIYAIPVFFVTLFIRLFKSEQKLNRRLGERERLKKEE